jgi:hypothetical protein
MIAFDVYIPASAGGGIVPIDTVFYSDGDTITADEVKRSLVEHDGYRADIIVKKVPKKRG